MKVDIKAHLSPDRATSGLNKLQESFHGIRRGLNEEFGAEKFLAFGAIFEALKGIVEEGAKLVHLSEQFGIGVESLQRISNAAKPNGATMEDVAHSMNKLIVAQDKARSGDEKITAALEDLKIKVDDFVNSSPEDAFYVMADAIKDSGNGVTAYSASVALLGRNAGVLYSTMQEGRDAIRAKGSEMGVMQEETARLLHDAEKHFQEAVGKLKVWGASGLAKMIKVGLSAKALATGMWEEFSRLWGGEGDKGKAAREMENIWGAKKPDGPKPMAHVDLEEPESVGDAREKLLAMYAQIDRLRQEALEHQMDGESRLQSMMRRVQELYEKAASEKDAQKQANMWMDAQNLEKDITSERQRVDAEEDQRLAKIAAAQEELADKQLATALAGATDAAQRIALLAEARAKKDRRILEAEDEEERLRLMGQREELEKQIAAIEKITPSAVASSLAKIGGGGGAYLSAEQRDAERLASAYEKKLAATQAFSKELQAVRQVIRNGARWSK